jgi:hypothetical protein
MEIDKRKIFGYPTSYAQRRMWFLSCLENENLVNNSTMEAIFEGIDLQLLEKSLEILVRRHDNFWTNFLQTENGEIVQTIRKPEKLKIQFFDISKEPKNIQSALEKEIIFENTNKPFDLSQDILFRISIVKISQNKYLFLLTFHHIVSDAWTLAVLWEELSEIYKNISSKKSNKDFLISKLQYKDYSTWEQSSDYLLKLSAQRDYWLKKLKDIPGLLDLPLDYLRPKAQTYNHRFLEFEFNKNEINKINKFCLKFNITLNTFFLAGFFILLYKISHKEDIVLGTYVANRDQMELERVAGVFLNNIPLRAKINDKQNILNFIKQVNQVNLEAMNNKDYPFEKLIDELKIKREPSFPPVFNVVFQIFNQDNNFLKKIFAGFYPQVEFYNSNFFQHEMILRVGIKDNKIGFDINYNQDLFKKTTIKLWGELYHDLIISMTEDENCLIKDISFPQIIYKKRLKLRQVKAPIRVVNKVDEFVLNSAKQKIIRIWEEVLGIKNISDQDNFFRLGGHSLRLIQVYDRLDKIYPGKLSIPDLFVFANVHDLAWHLCGGKPEDKEKILRKTNCGRVLDEVKSGEKSLEAAVENLLDL